MKPDTLSFAHRVLVAAAISALVLLGLGAVWFAGEVLLLAFAGVLLAILLRGISDWISRHTPLSPGWSLLVLALVMTAILAVMIWLLAPRVAAEVGELRRTLPESAEQLGRRLESHDWVRRILAAIPDAREWLPPAGQILSRVTGAFSRTFEVLVRALLIVFVGLCLAIEPGLYMRGAIHLVPPARRPRAHQVLQELGAVLRRWLLARAASMSAIAALTVVGLWVLNVPLALTLGLLAGLLSFIPNFGPILAALPAVLLALAQSPATAFYVVLLYTGVQILEGNLVTPLIERSTVKLPPALTILVQVLLGVSLGGLGLILAAPLTAVAITAVRMLYVEDVLKDRSD